jgi:predicted transcriptional regulator
MPATTTTSIKLDPAIKERVQRLADARRRSAHWVMKEAIEAYVEREEKQEQLRDELMTRWQEYEETGLHVGDEEARSWLTRLARGEKPPLPEPRG